MHENSQNSVFTVGPRSATFSGWSLLTTHSRTEWTIRTCRILGFHTKIPHFFEIWPNIPIYLMFAVQISIPYQYTSFWGSGIPIYLMFSENSSNIPIYRMHDLGAQKGHTNIPHVFEKWPNIPIYLNLTSTRKLLQAHCYIGIYPT